MSQAASHAAQVDEADESYVVLENLVRERFERYHGPIFETNAHPDLLWRAYLSGIPESRRKHYDCHSCRRFIQAYGGLVKLDTDGTMRSLAWQGDEEVPPFFATSIASLVDVVKSSRVTGVFLSPDSILGYERTIDKKRGRTWSHLHGRRNTVWTGVGVTASQKAAEKTQHFEMVLHAMRDYPSNLAAEVLRVLRSPALARSEKALGVAEWFVKLHEDSESGKNRNAVWLAVATAPPGFCNVRSTMISTLLDDVAAGLSFETISRRWSEKMDPLQYQRPTAAPKQGAIDQAEKLVAELGIARSLERRFATLEDVLATVWTPPHVRIEEKKTQGVFGHLRPQETIRPVNLPAEKITWEKFRRTALVGARSVEVYCPSHGNYYGLVTATHADAPPILQWDGLWEKDHAGHYPRNPVSAYVYHNGSPDLQEQGRGLALFPEILRSELHGVRSVIEAHSRSGRISGVGTANGLRLDSKGNTVTVRVDGRTYEIDRWD